MPGKMEDKIKEVLEDVGYSPVIRAIFRLARHIDEVEKQKEDDEFTSESDKKVDLPASTTRKIAGQEHPIIVSGTGGKLPDKPQSIPTSMSQLKAESQDTPPTPEPDPSPDKEVDLPATKPKFFPPHSLNPS